MGFYQFSGTINFMTTPYWLRPKTSGNADLNTNILIIGAGHAGLSTAYWLTEMSPDLKITILERSFCGAGASGRNAGFLTLGSASFYKSLFLKWGKQRTSDIYNFTKDSLDLVSKHILSPSSDIQFETTTSSTLMSSETQFLQFGRNDFFPEDYHFIWRKNNQLPPSLQSSFFGSYEAYPEFKINPIQYLASLKKILLARKVKIIENCSAFKLYPEGALTEINTIKAHKVVLALNGYFPQFHSSFKDLITSKRAQMIAVELEDHFNCPGLYYDPPERVYWRKDLSNVLLVGGKRLLDEVSENGDFEKNSPVIQAGLESYIKEQLGLKFKVLSRWSGIMGFTESELPIIDRISAPLETFMIGGFSGHGMGLGFKSGQEMAALIIGHKKESFFNQFRNAGITL